MPNQLPELLIVDDSSIDLTILKEMLGNNYQFYEAENGAKAVELCLSGECSPSVILLDVSMPKLSGYETCIQIKEILGFEHVEVIFISGNDSIEEKQHGYEAGGSDYLTKPVNPDELRQKVRLAVERGQQRKSSEAQSKTAMDAAMTAMMDAGEQAGVIHFLRDSFGCKTLEDLAQAIVTATSNFGLSNTVQIRTSSDNITVSSNGACPPLEVEMLTSLRNIGRIHQRGKRLILNFGDISQLIKNLPDDDAKVGRLRDHLAIILEGAESRADALLAVDEMKKLLKDTEESIGHIQAFEKSQKGRNVKVMDKMIEEIHASLFEYGLTEEQENVLLKMVERYSEDIFKVYEDGQQVGDSLNHVSATLNRAVTKFLA